MNSFTAATLIGITMMIQPKALSFNVLSIKYLQYLQVRLVWEKHFSIFSIFPSIVEKTCFDLKVTACALK
jgi:hypothetical protein